MNRYITWLLLFLAGSFLCVLVILKLNTYRVEHREAKKIRDFIGAENTTTSHVTPEEFFNYPPKENK